MWFPLLSAFCAHTNNPPPAAQFHRTVPFDAILGGGEWFFCATGDRCGLLTPSVRLCFNSGGRPGRLGCAAGNQGDAEERQTIVSGLRIADLTAVDVMPQATIHQCILFPALSDNLGVYLAERNGRTG